MMQTGCIPLKRIRKSNSSWKRKADMDEKPMKAINIVDKKTTKIKAPDVEIKIDVELICWFRCLLLQILR